MPQFRITAPDGSVYSVTGPDGATEQDALAQVQRQLAPNAPETPVAAPAAVPATNARIAQEAAYKGAAAVPDALLNAPTNLLNLGKAAFGTAATALGRSDLAPELSPTPDLARRGLEKVGLIDPAIQPQGTVQKGIDVLTQGAVGGALTGGATLPRMATGAGFGTTSAGASAVTQAATDSPALAATAGLLGGSPVLRTSKSPVLQTKNAVLDETLTRARNEGYVVPPSAAGGSFVGNRIEGIGGKAALGQEAAVRNQQITNKIARREAGLAENDPISEATLAAARDTMVGPYREVAALNPMAASALERLKQARADAKVAWQYYNRSASPDALKQAQSLDNRADTLEKVIDNAAARAGKPELLEQLRDARMRLAKNYEVDKSLNVGNGNVDAAVLGKMLDKRKPLSDGLETIARFQQAFPLFSREGAQSPGVSKLEGYGAVGLGAGGMAAGAGLWPALIPMVAPPAARSLMLSPAMQGQTNIGPTMAEVGSRVGPIVTNGSLANLMDARDELERQKRIAPPMRGTLASLGQ